MLIKSPKGWEIAEALATPEEIALNRRALITGAGTIAATSLLPATLYAAAGDADPSAKLYPAPRNPKFKLSRAITPEEINKKYNNFYEFGSHKQISAAAQALKVRPWTVKIDGLVEKPFTIDIDKLLARMQLEERLYRPGHHARGDQQKIQ